MVTQVQTPIEMDDAIRQMVEIIVDGWDPVQVILFGSRARGDHRDDSDVDLLVVLDEVADYPGQVLEIERALACTQTSRDVKLATPEDIVRKATVAGTIERAAMVEGRTLHVRGKGDPVTEQTLRWLSVARQDASTARDLLDSRPEAANWVCYMSQQSAEKSLKAALVADRIDPPRTHRLADLRDLLPPDWDIPGSTADLERVSKWVEQSRYFNGWEDLTIEDAVWGIDMALAIYRAVVSELQRRGVSVE